jgi:hypothetical protein
MNIWFQELRNMVYGKEKRARDCENLLLLIDDFTRLQRLAEQPDVTLM